MSEQEQTTKKKTSRVVIAVLIIVLLAIPLGIYGCTTHARKGVRDQGPQIKFVQPEMMRQDAPAYRAAVRMRFTGPVVFVEVVDDETYQRESNRLLTRVFAGRGFGGKTYATPGQDVTTVFSIPAPDLQRPTETKYWVRALAQGGETRYSGQFDRLLYSLVGAPVDIICGQYLYDIQYGLGDVKTWRFADPGEFTPFWVLAKEP